MVQVRFASSWALLATTAVFDGSIGSATAQVRAPANRPVLTVPTPPPAPAPLDPSSPMSPMVDIGVPWPDLGTRDASEGAVVDATPHASVNGDEARRYEVALTGIDGLDAVRTAFDAASTLKNGQGKGANVAQLGLRARDDAALMRELMRAAGYYDADVSTEVKPLSDRLAVTIAVVPGALYRFDQVAVSGLDASPKVPELRDAFAVKPSTPVEAERVIASELALREKLGRDGYPFAKVGESAVTVDHATQAAALALNVETGNRRAIADLRVAGTKPPFGAKHTAVIARFKRGDIYDQAMIDDLRRALIATGLVATARVEPVAVGEDKVDIVATMAPAPYRTLAGELGFGTGEGVRAVASWQHRNLVKPEGAVTFRAVAGTREQALGATLRMSNFHKRDVVLNARALVGHLRYPAYDANTIEIGANIERQTNILWQKRWTYSYGFELVASDERDFVVTAGINPRRTFFIGALPGTLAYDGTDNLLDPHQGFRLATRLSPEASLRGSFSGYLRAQFDGSYYQPFGERVVIAGRTRIGAIVGAGQSNIAPSRRYYAGGGGSVRGFGYQGLGPRNVLGRPIGGRSLAEFALEARIRLPFYGGNFGVVPFVDAGNVYDTQYPKLTGLRVGAGLGFRYYSTFGPIRFDLGTPIGRRPGESIVAVYVSLGQAF